MKIKLLAAIAALISVQGCASVAYECKLTHPGGVCASMSDTYSAALKAKGDNRETVFDLTPGSKVPHQPVAAVPAPAEFDGYPQPAERGMPVFNPARVHRVWTAPWTDANGILHGGEYVYFTTPGHWNYGSLTAAGNASGVLGPVKPGQYGFVPVEVTPKTSTATSTKKEEAQPPASSANATATPAAGINTKNGITQPFERLDNK